MYFLPANAAFKGPVEVISGTSGSTDNQFGIEYGDSGSVIFPWDVYILKDEGLIIGDLVNARMKIYDKSGKLTKIVKCIKDAAGEFDAECRLTGTYVETTPEGNILTGPVYMAQTGYALYSSTGKLLKTYKDIPAIRTYLKYKYIGMEHSIEILDNCGTLLNELSVKDDDTVSYGNLLVGPTGNVFTWKKREYEYSILKWTRVDGPEKRKQPCANTK
jgi:hypothetical protein